MRLIQNTHMLHRTRVSCAEKTLQVTTTEKEGMNAHLTNA